MLPAYSSDILFNKYDIRLIHSWKQKLCEHFSGQIVKMLTGE